MLMYMGCIPYNAGRGQDLLLLNVSATIKAIILLMYCVTNLFTID